jgi:hypothetical protein
LAAALEGRIVPMAGAPALSRPDFIVLNESATVPQSAHAQLICSCIERWGHAAAGGEAIRGAALRSFRPDLHANAITDFVNEARARPG